MPEKKVELTIKLGVVGEDKKEKLIKNLEKLGNTASKTSKKTKDSLKGITPTMQGLWRQADKLSRHWGVSFQTALPYVKKLGQSFKYASGDTYKLAQSAQQASQKFNVSFKQSYAVLKKMSVGLESVSHDTDKTAKAARKFAQDWGVSFKKAFAHVNKLSATTRKATNIVHRDIDKTAKAARKFAREWGVSFKDAYNHTSKLGVGMKKAEGHVKSSSEKMGGHLTFIAWHFRYLGSIFEQVSRSIIRGITDVIKVTSELEEAFLSIDVAAIMFGQSAERASGFAKELALTGLMPLQTAASSVKSLMITGLGMPEMEKFTYRYLDVTTLVTDKADEMATSLEAISKAILKGTPQLMMDVTAKTLWIETDVRLQKTIGKTMAQLTAQQRAMEILTTIETTWAATQGLTGLEMETTRAAITKLNNAILIMKNALGTALLPILHLLVSGFEKATIYVEACIKALGPAVPVIAAIAIVVTFLTAKISFLVGVFISLIKISGVTAAMMWKIYLPMVAVGAVLGVGVYLLLKYTGALDKAKNSVSSIEDQLKSLKEKLDGVNKVTEESIEVDDSRRIAHERNVADIEEDLERERSKGLWANQMAIKDLEKRLKRENEDWDRHLTELGGKEVTDPTAVGGMFGGLLDDANETVEELGKISWFEKIFQDLKDPEKWAKVRDTILDWVSSWMKSIKEIMTDVSFWRAFGQELGKNISSIITGIGDIVKAAFTGLFGSEMKGIGVMAALTFVTAFGIAFAKYFTTGGVGFLAAIKSATILGAGFTTALSAAIPATFVITITLLTGAALYQATKLKNTVDGMWQSTGNLIDRNQKLMDMYAEQFRRGTISAEEFNQKTKNIAQQMRASTKQAEEASFSWKKALTGEYFLSGLGIPKPYQTGGIVPGMRNEAVPIMAHGGERIIPAGEVNGGNVTVNINNPSVRNDNDIREIVKQVSQAMGQRANFSRLGAY